MHALVRGWRWLQDNVGFALFLLVGVGLIIGAWNVATDKLTFALAVAAAALTVWQARLAHTHNRLSVRPHVTPLITAAPLAPGAVGLRAFVRNAGLGPARFTKYDVWLDGERVEMADEKAVDAALKRFFGHGSLDIQGVFSLQGDFAMRAGDELDLLVVNFPPMNFGSWKALHEMRTRFRISIVYESIYGETFECPWPPQTARRGVGQQ